MDRLSNRLQARPQFVDRLATQENELIGFDRCPICGGELQEKEVEKLVRGGIHSALLRVTAYVCLQCGERLYALDVVQRFEEVRQRLERDETAGFEPIGHFFEASRT